MIPASCKAVSHRFICLSDAISFLLIRAATGFLAAKAAIFAIKAFSSAVMSSREPSNTAKMSSLSSSAFSERSDADLFDGIVGGADSCRIGES